MTAEVSNKSNPTTPAAGRTWIGLLSLGFILVVAISGQSLWIDEAFTARKAMQPTLPGWWQEMLREKGSDLQMPLYMIWIWSCEKIFGSGEWALRAVNLFWFVPGLVIFSRALAGRRSLAIAAFLVGAVSPFAWYYLNEARPYAMQLGASLFLFATLYHWNQNPASAASERGWVWGFIIALLTLSGGSMLGMTWAAVAVAALPVVLPPARLWQMFRTHIAAWAVALAGLVLLGIYYLWTLKIGARASSAATTDAKNVLFIGYELLGFAGLGPGRLAIREGGLAIFRAYGIGLAVYAVVVAGLIGFAARDLFRADGRKKRVLLGLLAALPAVFILAAGLFLHFRVLGRHFAPLTPVVFFLLALGVREAWRQGLPGRSLTLIFFALCFASCLTLRFAARHEKDDYRSAAAWAKAALARGQNVWWNASDSGADYYRLPITDQSTELGKAWWVMNPTSQTIADGGLPEVVVASRRDIYDGGGVLAEFLARNQYRQITNLPAFVIWERSAY